jgi:hypothetical protein
MIGKGSRKERGGHDDSNDRLSYQVGERHTVDLDTFEEVRWLST